MWVRRTHRLTTYFHPHRGGWPTRKILPPSTQRRCSGAPSVRTADGWERGRPNHLHLTTHRQGTAFSRTGGWPTRKIFPPSTQAKMLGCPIRTRSGRVGTRTPEPPHPHHASSGHGLVVPGFSPGCRFRRAIQTLPLCRRPSRSPQGEATELPSSPPPAMPDSSPQISRAPQRARNP